jgi:putative peptidoglycan lipid II flippase
MSTTLLRSSAVMAAGTLVSRLTGFVRGAMLAAAIGITGMHADIFTWANTVPNMLYILVAGGVFNSVLVPQIVRAMKNDADGGEAYVNRVLTLSGLFLAGVTAVLVAAAPWVMRLLTGPSFFDPALSEQTESFIDFARLCLPQVFFYGVFVLLGQVLNARGRFGPMMWAPIVNNLISIVVLAIYLAVFGGMSGNMAFSTGEELLLGLGSTLGIIAQTGVLVWYVYKAGVRYRPRFDFRDTGLGHTLRLAVWTVLFVVVNQVAYVVVGRIATEGSARGALAGESVAGITTYSQAFLVMMVPHAIVTVSLATALLPRLSALSADSKVPTVRSEISATLRVALVVVVPFCLLLFVVAPYLASILFGWEAAEGDTGFLALTLLAFSPGLVFFTIHYLMLRGFYAGEDTRTPFLVQVSVATTNIVAAVAITSAMPDIDVSPLLALAYGCAYLVGTSVSVTVLGRRLRGSPVAGIGAYTVRLLLAAVPATLVAYLITWLMVGLGVDDSSKLGALLLLVSGFTVFLASFVPLSGFLGLREVSDVLNAVFGRLRRRAPRHRV